jgi:hypothetical protein
MARPIKIDHPLKDTPSPPPMSSILQEHKLESAKFEAQWARVEASLLTLMSMIRKNERQKKMKSWRSKQKMS